MTTIWTRVETGRTRPPTRTKAVIVNRLTSVTQPRRLKERERGRHACSSLPSVVVVTVVVTVDNLKLTARRMMSAMTGWPPTERTMGEGEGNEETIRESWLRTDGIWPRGSAAVAAAAAAITITATTGR